MKQSPRNRTGLIGACTLALSSPVVTAADAALEEIIVTATKRETSLMETAASLSAFDSSMFDQLGITGSRDLTARTPSLAIGTFRVSIRGVGRPNLAVGSEPGVGIYWDGVYNTENGVFNYSQYMDIERIEVLRGPQGTLYGRNSIGGAINFISKRPTEEWSGTLTGELTNYDGYAGQAYVSGPLTDKLGFLAGYSKMKRDGFQENIYNGKDYDQNDIAYGTFGFEHRTTDNWTTNLKVIGVDRNQRQSAGRILEPFNRELIQQFTDVDTGAILNFPGMFASQNFVNMRQGLAITNPTLEDEDDVKVDRDPDLDNQRWAAFLTSEYSADTYSLKYTGGYSKYWFDTISDADHSVSEDSGVDWTQLLFLGTPVSAITGYTITPADMTYEVNQEAQFSSHELQYSSNWEGDYQLLAGLYYYHSDEEQVVMFREFNDELMETYAYFAGILGRPVSDDNFLYRGEANVDTRSYATYTQLSWDWTERTVLTGGLRYSYDDKKGNDNTFVQFVGDPADPTVFRAEDDDWDKITWRVGVDHNLDDNHFLYAFIANGYRSGGFNFQKPTSSTLVDVVEPEEITSYEVGYKGVMWDNRMNLAVSAYYYDYEDLQVLKQDVVEGIGLNTFVNADSAEAMGVEVESQLLVGDHWMLSGTYSWNDSEYNKFLTKDANACTLGPLSEGMSQDPLCTEDLDLAGNVFPTMPEHKVSANVTYYWNMLDYAWSGTVSYFYTDDQWATAFNNPEYDDIGSYDTWDARLSVAHPEGTWEAIAWVKNLEDDRDVVGRGRPSTVTQNATSDLQAPRTYGLRVNYNF